MQNGDGLAPSLFAFSVTFQRNGGPLMDGQHKGKFLISAAAFEKAENLFPTDRGSGERRKDRRQSGGRNSISLPKPNRGKPRVKISCIHGQKWQN